MITYKNDVLSEIWDAKRLIREYVNVAHLISHFMRTVICLFQISLKSATIIQYTIKGRFMSR